MDIKLYTFTYQVPVTGSDYTYVYAGLSWSEYWASEGVLAPEVLNLPKSWIPVEKQIRELLTL